MDAKQAAALRAPFPAGAVGKLPKPYKKDSAKGNCKDCGGYHGLPAVHLDYVGHAACTDRLLQVDPEWSWEPMAYDMGGLPLFDGNRNLWIKLTVCGVTRLGVGDGMSLKECIGDAIRNAAMRFGVALDLWAKEDLHAMAEERGTEAPATQPSAPAVTRTMSRPKPAGVVADAPAPVGPSAPDPAMSAPDADGITDAQLTKLHTSFTKAGIKDRDKRLTYVANILGVEVESSKDLSKAQAHKIIESLAAVNEAPFGDEPPVDESS